MEFFDSHAHYNDEKFEYNKDILNEIYSEGITRVICAGYNLKSSVQAIEIANKNNFVYATAGISPNDLEDYGEAGLIKVKELASNKRVVAIGEIGLDYYWNKENKNSQKEAFIKQIEIANTLDLPIVIHTRDAIMDTIDILRKQKRVTNAGVVHCCPLNAELIKETLKIGFYISFAGPITFKNSKNVEEVISSVPLDKILIETDAPYLSPEPVRGTINNSINVKHIAKKIADVRKLSIEEIAEITYKNAKQVFSL